MIYSPFQDCLDRLSLPVISSFFILSEDQINAYISEVLPLIQAHKKPQAARYKFYHSIFPFLKNRVKATGLEQLAAEEATLRYTLLTQSNNRQSSIPVHTMIKPSMNFFDASLVAASTHLGNKHVYLMMSGGLSSEFVAEMLLEAKVKFTPVIIQFIDENHNVINQADIVNAFDWCYDFGIEPEIFKFNISKLWQNQDVIKNAISLGVTSPKLLTMIHLATVLSLGITNNEILLFGNDLRFDVSSIPDQFLIDMD